MEQENKNEKQIKKEMIDLLMEKITGSLSDQWQDRWDAQHHAIMCFENRGLHDGAGGGGFCFLKTTV